MANDNPQPGNRFTGTMPNPTPNSSSPDKVFGGSMPTGQQPGANSAPVSSEQVYGNQNYYSQNLQGYQTTADFAAQSYTQYNGQVGQQSTTAPQPNYNPQQPPAAPPTPQRPPQNTLFGMQSAENYSAPKLDTVDSKIEYLNSIAPDTGVTKAANSLLADKKLLAVIGAGVVAVIALIIMLTTLGRGSQGESVSVSTIINPAYELQQSALAGQTAPQLDTESRIIANQIALILQSKMRTLVSDTSGIGDTGEIEDVKELKESTEADFEKIKSSGNAPVEYLKYTNHLIEEVADKLAAAGNSHSSDQELFDKLNSAYKDLMVMHDRIAGALSRKTRSE